VADLKVFEAAPEVYSPLVRMGRSCSFYSCSFSEEKAAWHQIVLEMEVAFMHRKWKLIIPSGNYFKSKVLYLETF
jgi:hypothetical protein